MSSIERAMERMRRAPAAGAVDVTAAQMSEPEPAPASDPAVALDLAALRELGMLTPDADQRALQEQYRLVKRQLLARAFRPAPDGGNPVNLIQITSALASEGKTFTAFNLAISVAMEVDFTVLLVDADLTRRGLTHLIGLQGRPGITELLAGEVGDVGSIVTRTDIPRLSVIPAGQGHPRSTELVASDAMRRLSREVTTRYHDRLVIVDSTPLLMDSQAATLAAHVGQIVVVVEASRTAEMPLRNAIALLDPATADVGLLLNKSMARRRSSYYDDAS